jgi:hypothetical protein
MFPNPAIATPHHLFSIKALEQFFGKRLIKLAGLSIHIGCTILERRFFEQRIRPDLRLTVGIQDRLLKEIHLLDLT